VSKYSDDKGLKFGLACLVVALAAALAFGAWAAAPAQAQRTLSVQPPTRTVTSGSTFGLSVAIDNATNLAGVQFDLAFDSSLIAGVSVTQGALLTGWTFQSGHPGGDPGVVRVVTFTWGAPLSGGSGDVAVFTFQAIAAGTTPANITGIVLSDGAGNAIPAVAANGQVTVQAPNEAPTASFTYSPSHPTDLDVISFSDTSTDSDGSVVSWSWSFGDGATSTAHNPTHQYADDGIYTVTLVVTDDDGAPSTPYSTGVAVANVAPRAAFAVDPPPLVVGEPINFTDASTDDDGTVVACSWDFGDGATSTDENPAHTYSAQGTYTVSLIVTDDDGAASAAATTDIEVWAERNLFVSDVSGHRGQQVIPLVSIDDAGGVAGFQMDVGFDAGSKTVVGVAPGSLLTSEWTVQFSQPAVGVVRIIAFTWPVTELPSGGGDPVAITFQERADAPKATTALTLSNVVLSTGDALSIPVVTHDGSNTVINRPPVLDAIGNRSVNEGQLLTFTVTASDPDGDALTYSASNLPSGANFNTTTHVFTWTPGYGQAGSYPNVHFEVMDGSLSDSEDITITVNNVNRPPVLDAIGNRSVNEGQLLTFTVTASDPDGDALTYSASNLPSGANFNTTTHVFTWTPGYGQAGSYPNVHFEVMDGSLSDSEDITITVNAAVARNLYVSHVSALPGGSVTPAVSIDQAAGIARFEFDVGFDPASKTVASVSAGALLPKGWKVQYSQPGPGVVRISGYNRQNNELGPGSGNLAVITFQERADAPTGTTALTLGNVALSNGAGGSIGPAVTHNGSNQVVPPPPPAIRIDQFSAPSRAKAGQTGTLTVVVRNMGTVATDVTVQVDRILPLPETAVGAQTVNLAAGARARLTFTYTFRAADAPLATFRATATTPTGQGATAQASTRVSG